MHHEIYCRCPAPKIFIRFFEPIRFSFHSYTVELPQRNVTSDNTIAQKANNEDCIVITKDTDFLESYLLFAIPAKLIVVKPGNIKNTALLQLFNDHLNTIVTLLNSCNLIEITKDEIISHS